MPKRKWQSPFWMAVGSGIWGMSPMGAGVWGLEGLLDGRGERNDVFLFRAASAGGRRVRFGHVRQFPGPGGRIFLHIGI